MKAKIACNFRLFGNFFEGLLYSDELDESRYYWINDKGTLMSIDCSEEHPIDEETSRYELPEKFKLIKTGFYGSVSKVSLSSSLFLYKTTTDNVAVTEKIHATFDNGNLVSFALL